LKGNPGILSQTQIASVAIYTTLNRNIILWLVKFILKPSYKETNFIEAGAQGQLEDPA
jgi:hypothetical protein